MYQPREGFCPLGTLNTVLYSLYSKASLAAYYETQPDRVKAIQEHPTYESILLKYPAFPAGMMLEQLAFVTREAMRVLPSLTGASSSSASSTAATVGLPLPDLSLSPRIEALEVLHHISQPEWRLILSQLNNPRYRFLVNFSRTPLFHSALPLSVPNFFTRIIAGHWSPIGAYLAEEDLILLLDVNESYGGGYLVNSSRMLDAVNTADMTDPHVPRRGVLRMLVAYPS